MPNRRYGNLQGPFYWQADVTKRRRFYRKVWHPLRAKFGWGKESVLHSYRHTVASRLVEAQGHLDPVQYWLGHQDPKMTQRYRKYRPDQQRKLAALLAAA